MVDSKPDEALPGNLLRLFPDHDPEHLLDREHRMFLIARLLEEGDREDLRWLFSQVDHQDLVSWLRTRGGRSLSRRSRLFWAWVLGVESSPSAEIQEEIWLL